MQYLVYSRSYYHKRIGEKGIRTKTRRLRYGKNLFALDDNFVYEAGSATYQVTLPAFFLRVR